MDRIKWLIILVPIGIYMLLGVVVSLHTYWYADAQEVADGYLRGLQQRDLKTIYRTSSLAQARLSGMLTDSNVDEPKRQKLLDQDYSRWQAEFQKASKSKDMLWRERELISAQVAIKQTNPAEYQVETMQGRDGSLTSYQDLAGRSHQFYYQLSYPTKQPAPKVGILDNIPKGKNRRIRSVVIRVETTLRPDVGWTQALIMGWGWLDTLAIIYPHRHLLPTMQADQVWMAGIGLSIDKQTLTTF